MKKNYTTRYWKNIYRQAFAYYGEQLPQAISLPQLKKRWQKLRTKLKTEGMTDIPTVREVAKRYEQELDYEKTERNENMETKPPKELLEFNKDYIDKIKETIERVYQDTLTDAESKSKTAEGYFIGRAYETGYMLALKEQLLSTLDQAVAKYGYQEVGKAIASDEDLNFTVAIVYQPPSDVEFVWETTLEHLNGIIARLEIDWQTAYEQAEENGF